MLTCARTFQRRHPHYEHVTTTTTTTIAITTIIIVIIAGIMDYGDGFYNDVEQFNTKYRKEQICGAVDAALQERCGGGLVVAHAVICGDSLVEHDSGEECECADGSQSCQFCVGCKLQEGKECSPDAFDPVCCTDSGMYEPIGMQCDADPFDNGLAASDIGYCSKGECIETGCRVHAEYWPEDGFTGGYCSLLEGNPCQSNCASSLMLGGGSSNEPTCERSYNTFNGRPLAWVPDATPCKDSADNWSRCGYSQSKGDYVCLPAPAACGNGIVDAVIGEQCECAGKVESCAQCNSCKLAGGKECSPDAFDTGAAECCNADGTFAEYKAWCTAANGRAGFCTRGICTVPEGCSSPYVPQQWVAKYGFDGMCDIEDGGCGAACTLSEYMGGGCYAVSGFMYGSRPLSFLQDGALCVDGGGDWSVCVSGQCIAAPCNAAALEACGNAHRGSCLPASNVCGPCLDDFDQAANGECIAKPTTTPEPTTKTTTTTQAPTTEVSTCMGSTSYRGPIVDVPANPTGSAT